MAIPPADPLLGAALACVDQFYARMFRDWPDAVNRVSDTWTLSYSGDQHLTGANHLWPHAPDAVTERALREAEEFFDTYHAAWSVVYTDTFMPQAAALLDRHGYYRRWHSPLMVLDAPPTRLPTRFGGEVIRASSVKHLDDVRRVMNEAFGTGTSVNQRVVRAEHLGDPGIRHYLLYAGREPAACAMVAMCGEMAGVWNVGTRYRYRRQGFATRVMLALLDDLRACGCPVSVLMASPEGQPLYQQLGYREIGNVNYMGPPFVSTSRYFH
ncbi:MAG TPA: GNAT family N-acetyltransferase [Aggregatilineaceae bacterium]|nr:GNAT family N-acetyltransferase [Aggregatilineaceae bacterium]